MRPPARRRAAGGDEPSRASDRRAPVRRPADDRADAGRVRGGDRPRDPPRAMTAPAVPPRAIRLVFRGEWTAPDGKGLLGADPRLRTLRKVLVSYPAVRHILPDRISLEASADSRTLDAVARFLARQHSLVKAAAVPCTSPCPP